MAFRFNGILDFNAKRAIQNMKLTKKEMEKLRSSGQRMSKGFGQIAQGAQGAAFATAPFAIATGLAIREAAGFEAQMSTVRSVLLASTADMIPLEKLTKRLGATTAFTAQQAGEGSEQLARAGFTTQQIMAALPGVLDAAAASGVGLAEASNVIASNIGAFGLAASDATKVADILALTTARTNTSFTELGEGLKLAAPFASQVGLSLASTASALGIFANAGVKGTLGATALRSALNKLANPTKNAIELFGGKKGMNAAMIEIGENGKKRLKPMEVIMANVAKAVQSARDPLEAAGRAAEIFGLRGTTAFSSFQKQLIKTVPITEANKAALIRGAKETGENIDEFLIRGIIPKLVALRLEINGAAGSAKEMAAIRLDNLSGQFTLFKSALSGFAIEVGTKLTKPLKTGLKVATNGLSGIVAAFQVLNASSFDEVSDLRSEMVAIFGSEGAANVQNFVSGFVAGIDSVVEGVKTGFAKAKAFLEPFFKGTDTSSTAMGKLAAQIILIGAVAAPILAGIVGFLFVMGPIIIGITGMFNVMIGMFAALKVGAVFLATTFGFWLIPIIALIALAVVFRNEIFAIGKTIGKELLPIWGFVKDSALEVFGILKTAFGEVIGEFTSGASVSKDAFGGFLEAIKIGVQVFVAIALPIFKFFIGNLIAGIKFVATIWVGAFKLISSVVQATFAVFNAFFSDAPGANLKAVVAIEAVWASFKNFFMGMWDGLKDFVGTVFDGMTKLVFGFINGSTDGFKQWKNDVIGFSISVWDSFKSGAANLWISIKASFIDPMRDAISALPDLVATKIRGAKDFVLDNVPGASFFFDREEPAPTADRISDTEVNAATESSKLLNESLRQKKVTAPTSANDIGQSVGKSVAASTGGGTTTSNINVSLSGEFRMRGRDLNLVVSKHQIEVGEKNGVQTDPSAKRKIKQNGRML